MIACADTPLFWDSKKLWPDPAGGTIDHRTVGPEPPDPATGADRAGLNFAGVSFQYAVMPNFVF